jgi:hypothetical protein
MAKLLRTLITKGARKVNARGGVLTTALRAPRLISSGQSEGMPGTGIHPHQARRGIIKEAKMKRMIAAVIAAALGTAVIVVPAVSWEKGTHLYFADKLKRQGGMNPMNLDEMYGAMTPDIFNYVFDLPPDVYAYLYDQTHHYYGNMWKAVKRGYEKPLAFGFVSHNDKWGADYTAHHNSRTLNPLEGYIITKAGFLNAALTPYWAYIEELIGGGALDPAVKLELCHNIVEAAGDIVLKRSYPHLGKNLVAAGSRSDKRFKDLFLRAYLPGFATIVGSESAARDILLNGEAAFRTYQVVMYGMLLQQDEAAVIDGIAAQFNSLVGGYLASKGIALPAGTDLTGVIHDALAGAIGLIESDYMLEVDATLNYLRSEMKRRKFWASTKKGDVS